jgi:hypothetical protein
MDKKTFFHKVSQMRAAQREYFKTRSSAALASSKLLERQIDEEIKRAKAVMAAKAKLFYELVNIDPQTSQEWLNDHIRESLDFFFCDADVQHQSVLNSHFYDNGFSGTYDFPTIVINDMGDTSDDDMLEFKYEYINHKYYVTFLNRLKG